MTHVDKHPLAGQTVKVRFKNGHPQLRGSKDGPVDFRVEDWWDRLTGRSWGLSDGNPAALVYAVRAGLNRLPSDDEVVYGHDLQGFGHLVHVTEVLS